MREERGWQHAGKKQKEKLSRRERIYPPWSSPQWSPFPKRFHLRTAKSSGKSQMYYKSDKQCGIPTISTLYTRNQRDMSNLMHISELLFIVL